MAELAVTFLLENLITLVVEKMYLISGVKSELHQVIDELRLMKALLMDSGESLRGFERDIREAVYSAEDIIDPYVTQSMVRDRRFFRIPARINLSKTLKAFSKQQLSPLIDHAFKATQDTQLPFLREENVVGLEDETYNEDETTYNDVVGLEDETELLMKYLNEESEGLDVISIVGMPGLGKTTLAWKIYRDPRMQYEFPLLIWISASQAFNTKNVFLTILNKFTLEDMSELTNSLLADIVRNNLENHKFLLFIDGVRTTQDWRLIEVALPMSNIFGKVIITTRFQQVAREASRKRNPHCVRFLTPDESWELLQLQTFGRLHGCPSNLEELGKRIAVKCEGLPISIVLLGGILLKKLSASDVVNEWEKVLSSLPTYFHHDTEGRMENIISFSYNNLPFELRDCFLYMGVFPQDTVILAWKLVRLWIAEGFIQPRSGKSLEEVAEDNLKQLVDRNLVMVEETKVGGGIKTCRLSNMIQEFCTSRASFEQENLFQEVKRSSNGYFSPPISEIQKCRRLCIHSYIDEYFIHQRPKGPVVRSFLSCSKEATILLPSHVTAITEAFVLLRVFYADVIGFSKFPPKLTHLIHLRYIALSGDDLRSLPEAVEKLWNLQTIRIDTTLRTLEIRADIWSIIRLRHLKTKAAIVMKKEAKGKGGENLQTLSRLSTHSFSEDMCRRALNLKNLGIRGNLNTLLSTNSMARLDRLQKLKLLHDVYPNGTVESPLIHLPSREAFPPNLRILELSSTFLEWKHMDTLGMLLTLEILKLKQNAFTGRLWKVNDGLFPSLEVLLIKHSDLEDWTVSEDSFPRLKCLVLKNCQNLREIPHVLARCQALDIEQVPESAVESAMRIKMEKLQMQDQTRAKKGDNLSSGFSPEFDRMPN